jgi:hypothetical protein
MPDTSGSSAPAAVRPGSLASRRKPLVRGPAKEDSASIGTRIAPQEPAMTKTFALVLAALVTASTFVGANTLAGTQYAKADATAHMQVLAAQTVVIVGHRV